MIRQYGVFGGTVVDTYAIDPGGNEHIALVQGGEAAWAVEVHSGFNGFNDSTSFDNEADAREDFELTRGLMYFRSCAVSPQGSKWHLHLNIFVEIEGVPSWVPGDFVDEARGWDFDTQTEAYAKAQEFDTAWLSG